MTLCDWATVIAYGGMGLMILATVVAAVILNVVMWRDRVRDGVVCTSVTLFVVVVLIAAYVMDSELCQ